MRRTRGLALSMALLSSAPLAAAEIKILNTNTAGQGFNDTTAAAPVGGNPGTTIGQQRLKVFEEAARIWGALLQSNVPINVDSSFVPLTCDANSAVLGSAGTRTVHADFDGALLSNTWYPQALANKLSGADDDPSTSDIRARFNSNLGNTGCLTGSGFYYGFDGNHGDKVDLLAVVLHEFGHGFGFQTFVDSETGEQFNGMPDAFSYFIFDDTRRLGWDYMTDEQRRDSSLADANLVWTGSGATAASPAFLRNQPRLQVSAPAAAAGRYAVGTAAFGAPLTVEGVNGPLVRATDGVGVSTDGCEAITNGSEISGKIALIDRGSCTFVIKVKNAQNAGARAVVIADNQPGSPPSGMAGTDDTITIPSVRVTLDDGNLLKANLPATVALGLDPARLAGADLAGHLLLYAPTEYSAGSSVSHFDTSASPNLLMEPFISSDLGHGVDVTIHQLEDMGWSGAVGGTGNLPTWVLPSSARVKGVGGSYYTTDLTVSNQGGAPADVTLQFTTNNADGRNGPKKSVTIQPGRTTTFTDVLKTLFEQDESFGGITITSTVPAMNVISQTSTPAGSGRGTFGQSVPAAAAGDVIVHGTPRAVAGVREDAAFRSNLVVTNVETGAIDVDVSLLAEDGGELGHQTITGLRPLEMRQVSRIAEALTGGRNVPNATLVLSTPTVNGAFVSYVASIDNVTQDPRTLLPSTGAQSMVLASSARVHGVNSAFFTTDLYLANRSASDAHVTLKFTGHDTDGRGGPERAITIGPGKSVVYADVLASLFGIAGDAFGAIRITSDQPVVALGQTSTPAGGVAAGAPATLAAGGTYGQSVPAMVDVDFVRTGGAKSIAGIREDDAFRTNLIIVNTTESPLDLALALYAEDGSLLGAKTINGLGPLEMRQVSRVAEDLSGHRGITGATLILSTSTPGGGFAAYAAAIDNQTNDPRTLLPR